MDLVEPFSPFSTSQFRQGTLIVARKQIWKSSCVIPVQDACGDGQAVSRHACDIRTHRVDISTRGTRCHARIGNLQFPKHIQ